jgi:phage terminase large subunit GpA-like protein
MSYAKGLKPDPVDLKVSEWINGRLVLAPGVSPVPGKWSNLIMPYLVEIMDCLMSSHPALTVTIMKGAQSGGSQVILNFLAYLVANCPGATMIVHPTVEAAKSWVKEKLGPTIEANRFLSDKIRGRKSRDAGNTAGYKRFPGGFMVIAGANSAPGLRQKSIRYLIKDDNDDFPLSLGKQGDPDEMANARQMAYLATHTAKRLQVSTPTNKGQSRIGRAYEASDQRRYFVPCPHCGYRQVLRFFPKTWEPFAGGLRFNKEPPWQAHYVCEDCGCVIEHWHKGAMLEAGRWVATKPGPGREPGFALNTLYSPLTAWDDIAKAFFEAKDSHQKMKTFTNLWFGEELEDEGEAPDWELLMKARMDYRLGQVPPGVLFLTMAVDAQRNRLEWAVYGWGIGMTSYLIDWGVIAGDPQDDEVWRTLDTVRAGTYRTWRGRDLAVQACAVDSGDGAATHRVYLYCRRAETLFAIKGSSDRLAPPIGSPKAMDIAWDGRRIKGGCLLWSIGTWGLKSQVYGALRRTLKAARSSSEPPLGRMVFPAGVDEDFFRQLTAEVLVTDPETGKQQWKPRPGQERNEQLDMAVYARAMAIHLGGDTLTGDQWLALAAQMDEPADDIQRSLERLWQSRLADDDTEEQPSEPAAETMAQATWIDPEHVGGWFGR